METLVRDAHADAPPAVTMSIALWFTAIGCGIAESLVHLLTPDPPAPAALAARYLIYAALALLVMALHSGRNAVRWAVAGLLGVIGTASLLVEPVRWLAAGGSIPDFLAAATGSQLVIVTLRAVHVLAVAAALVALFRPAASRWFTRERPAGPTDRRPGPA
ncbi:hypothetical protein GCM10009836_71580 [Pseudonocardia ailaonensis]|uniref:Uncharacterized protein n=1 Tax=Pseudonocardia ailaonensis TaxID=367279 RepID=A0ABN2NPD1_9PSEU